MATAAGVPIDAIEQRNSEIASLRARVAQLIEANGELTEKNRVAAQHVVAAESLQARRLTDLDEARAQVRAVAPILDALRNASRSAEVTAEDLNAKGPTLRALLALGWIVRVRRAIAGASARYALTAAGQRAAGRSGTATTEGR